MKEVLSHSNLKRTLENKELEMETSNIAIQLLQGSSNLNRMQNQINQIIRTLMGLSFTTATLYPQGIVGLQRVSSPTRDNPQRTGVLIHVDPVYTWETAICVHTGVILNVWCHLSKDNDARLIPSIFEIRSGIPTPSPTSDIPKHQVQGVYESLPGFIEALGRTLPHLTQKWTPFIEASKIFLN